MGSNPILRMLPDSYFFRREERINLWQRIQPVVASLCVQTLRVKSENRACTNLPVNRQLWPQAPIPETFCSVEQGYCSQPSVFIQEMRYLEKPEADVKISAVAVGENLRALCTIMLMCWAGASHALTVPVGAESLELNVSEEELDNQPIFLREQDIEVSTFEDMIARRMGRLRHLEELGRYDLLQEAWEELAELEENANPEFCEQSCGETETLGTGADVNVAAVPLPASWLLLVGAVTGLFGVGKIRANRSA